MKNILFYIPFLSQEGGGTRQYAIALLKILAKDKTFNNYFILHNNNDAEILSIVNKNKNLFLIPKSIGTERNYEKKITNFLRLIDFIYSIRKIPKKIRVSSYLDRICSKYNIDILHSPSQHNPYSRKTKNIFTLHDVQELHFPEYFTPEEREYRARNWLSSINRADKIVVSYEHVKDDLIKYFQITPAKVDVILLDMENLWFDKFSPKDIVDIIHLQPFYNFLLYPANTWQHKNHLRLLEAILYLREKENIIVNIVFTGHKNSHFEKIQLFLNDNFLNNQVKFIGIVEEVVLYSLYLKALGVVIPTTYEAGSFPLIESIFLNVPVICARTTSLTETIGNLNFTFDPFDIIGIADKVKEIWTDSQFRSLNKIQTLDRKNHLKSTGAYEKLLRLYDTIKVHKV